MKLSFLLPLALMAVSAVADEHLRGRGLRHHRERHGRRHQAPRGSSSSDEETAFYDEWAPRDYPHEDRHGRSYGDGYDVNGRDYDYGVFARDNFDGFEYARSFEDAKFDARNDDAFGRFGDAMQGELEGVVQGCVEDQVKKNGIKLFAKCKAYVQKVFKKPESKQALVQNGARLGSCQNQGEYIKDFKKLDPLVKVAKALKNGSSQGQNVFAQGFDSLSAALPTLTTAMEVVFPPSAAVTVPLEIANTAVKTIKKLYQGVQAFKRGDGIPLQTATHLQRAINAMEVAATRCLGDSSGESVTAYTKVANIVKDFLETVLAAFVQYEEWLDDNNN